MVSVVVAPWKQLLVNALDSNANLKHSSYFQLATIGTNGRPANRTVVFRGFQDESDKIQINTDCRTSKVEDLKHCPFAEVQNLANEDKALNYLSQTRFKSEPLMLLQLICWYFTSSWEQFRINGRVDIIDGLNPDPMKLQQREKAWFGSSLRSRLQYLGPTPGLPCITEEPSHESHLDPSAGPDFSFCLLVMDAEQVDYLNLKTNKRLSFTSKQSRDGGKCWNSEQVNP